MSVTGFYLIVALSCVLFVSARGKASYNVIFFDDFDGTSLNSEVWSTWNNVTHCSPCELQLYMDKNVAVSDGYLTITTLKETVVAPNNEQYNYTSGWVTAKDKVSNFLGLYEVRAKLPSPEATGTWPAHWLMPQSDQCWPTGGEIDIMEATASPKANYHIVGSYRWGTECTTDEQILPGAAYPPVNETIIDFSEDFHVFAVEWLSDKIIFSVDGNEYETVSGNDVILPTAPMYFILNTAVAWYMPPGPNAVYPATHIIDWVRISQ
jgi:beta-glucanase (GH16 family)